ncbi:MAG: hypothetical protein HXX13_15995 [Bacteroidetes bacterium]|nr:hypothetical protein [Bacteroidota bacterium]
MKITGFTVLMLLVANLAMCQPLGSWFKDLESKPLAERTRKIDSLLSVSSRIPIIESDTNVYFIYKGDAGSVFIAGDATGWAPALAMHKIGGTDTWYCMESYEASARLEYKFVINKSEWILDPLNPRKVTGGTGQNSEILMPAYEYPHDIDERDVVPWGTEFDTLIHSKYLSENRAFRIILPASYDKGNKSYPLVFFHDGYDFFKYTAARNVINNMIFERKIQPVIAVFVEPVHRDDEYSGRLQKNYTRFMVNELIPFMDRNYRTEARAESRAQIGISNGGNIALWLVASQPGKTAKAAAMSSNVMKNVGNAFQKGGCRNQMIYLLLGKYDLPPLIPMVRNLNEQLRKHGCQVSYHEYPEGHSWKYWEKYLPDALEYFFPAK